MGNGQSSAQRAAADDSEEGVTLNLVNVPAAQAAKTILGDILKVRYTVDPKIEGRITIQTLAPVAKAAAMDLFQAALRSNSAAVVSSNGMYRILTIAWVANAPPIFDRMNGADNIPPGGTYET